MLSNRNDGPRRPTASRRQIAMLAVGLLAGSAGMSIAQDGPAGITEPVVFAPFDPAAPSCNAPAGLEKVLAFARDNEREFVLGADHGLAMAAKARGLGFQLDGARFANAVASTGASPADLTWRAGVEVLSFGFVKNGGMNAEALIFFDPRHAEQARVLRKRSGHLLSKGRFLAAQLLAMLNGGVWLGNARAANAAAQLLAKAAAGRLVYPVQANELFVRMTPEEAAAIRAQGFDFYDWAPGEVRLVTSWDQDLDAVAALAKAIEAL